MMALVYCEISEKKDDQHNIFQTPNLRLWMSTKRNRTGEKKNKKKPNFSFTRA